jgi:predicted Zn-dependent protease with MMP-like domain
MYLQAVSSSQVRLGQHQMDKTCNSKDEGLGVMISAFVSREFGFGMNLSDEQLQEVKQVQTKQALVTG